jgi:hypothetical protein
MMHLPSRIVALVVSYSLNQGIDGKQTEIEAISWVLFRIKIIRTSPLPIRFVDRRSDFAMEGTVGLVMLESWSCSS